MQELSLAKECVIKKLDLLTNSTIVDDDDDDEVKFIS